MSFRKVCNAWATCTITGEIGDVLAARLKGRIDVHEIAIAKFIRFGAQDLAAAETSLSMLGQFSNEAPAAIPLSG